MNYQKVRDILGSGKFMGWLAVIGSIIMVLGCAAGFSAAPEVFIPIAMVSWFFIVILGFASGWFWAEKHMSKDWPEERKTP